MKIEITEDMTEKAENGELIFEACRHVAAFVQQHGGLGLPALQGAIVAVSFSAGIPIEIIRSTVNGTVQAIDKAMKEGGTYVQ